MQFPVCVTERSGLGISWDNETPPLYDDVPQGFKLPSYDQSKADSSDDVSKLPVTLGRGRGSPQPPPAAYGAHTRSIEGTSAQHAAMGRMGQLHLNH